MIKLLLVEDDANLAYIVQSGLEDLVGGYEVTVAGNGADGLKAWEESRPDVIVSDIEMPVMDGYEMVRRIRQMDAEAGCPHTGADEAEGRCGYSPLARVLQAGTLYA